MTFYQNINVAIEERRRDIERVTEMQGGIYAVRGSIEFTGTGETLSAVAFPIAFTEQPFFSFGPQITSSSIAQYGNYPTLDATVVSWNFIIKPDTGLRLYVGASIAISCTGHPEQQVILGYEFEGKGLRNPVDTVAPAGGLVVMHTYLVGGVRDHLPSPGFQGAISASTDLYGWTFRTTPTFRCLCIAYGNGTWIAGASPNVPTTPCLFTSPDSLHWTPRSSPLNDDGVGGIAYGNGVWIASGQSADQTIWLIRSTDAGLTWTAIDNPFNDDGGGGRGFQYLYNGLGAPLYHNGVWVLAGGSGDYNSSASIPSAYHIMTSVNNGVTWTAQSTPLDGQTAALAAIIHAGGQYVAVGARRSGTSPNVGSDIVVLSSPDAIVWTEHSDAFAVHPTNRFYQLNAIAYGNGTYVAVGYGGESDFLGPDDAIFNGTVGHWRTRAGDALTRTTPPTPPPSASPHVGKVTAGATRTSLLAAMTAGEPDDNISVPAIFHAGAGFHYTFTAWIYLDAPTSQHASFTPDVRFYDPAGTLLGDFQARSTAYINQGDGWLQISSVADSPFFAAWASVFIEVVGEDVSSVAHPFAAGDAFYISDVAFTAAKGIQGVFTSPDAITWTSQHTPVDSAVMVLTAVMFDEENQIFVLGGFAPDNSGGTSSDPILTSHDGVVWSLKGYPFGTGLTAIDCITAYPVLDTP